MPTVSPLVLDGATLEGGGQLVRVVFCLAAITGIPVQVYNIRANRGARPGQRDSRGGTGKRGGRGARSQGRAGTMGATGKVEGGAKESHLAALIWLARRCGGHLEGAAVGSRDITFMPGAIKSGQQQYRDHSDQQAAGSSREPRPIIQDNVITLERPGSVCLILQCILPYLLFTPQTGTSQDGNGNQVMELTLKGGTNVSKAMSVDYVQHVFLPVFRRLMRGTRTTDDDAKSSSRSNTLPKVQLETVRRGWAGSASQIGEVKLLMTWSPKQSSTRTTPLRISSFNAIERGDVSKVSIILVAHTPELRRDLAERIHNQLALLFPNPASTSSTPQLDFNIPVETIVDEESDDIRRMYVLLVAHTTNGYRLGADHLSSGRRPRNAAEQRKIVEQVVLNVTRNLSHEVQRGGCVDQYMMDQLVVFQALAKGEGRIDGGTWEQKTRGHASTRLRTRNGDRDEGNDSEEDTMEADENGTLHARTVRWACERVLARPKLSERHPCVRFASGGVCDGVGWNWDLDLEDEDVKLKEGMRNVSIGSAA